LLHETLEGVRGTKPPRGTSRQGSLGCVRSQLRRVEGAKGEAEAVNAEFGVEGGVGWRADVAEAR
jgi:hypothetical protein